MSFLMKKIYFIGIGGIGMSALARYFKQLGYQVAGYDRTKTPLTDALSAEGIEVIYEDNVDLIPNDFREPSLHTHVVYTPAIPNDLVLLNEFKNKGFDLKKRSQMLGLLSEDMFCIAVAGTHGKTTTSTIIAHILTDSGYGCSAFLGGIASNYNTNMLIGNNKVVVVEADEFDRSFLTLHPDVAVVTSMDADHLDVYGDKQSLEHSFRQFVAQIKPDGRLISHASLPLSGVRYANGDEASIRAQNISIKNGTFTFDFENGVTTIKQIALGIPGWHNVENAIAAIEVALGLGIASEKIKTALQNFKGVKRRFEYIIKTDNQVFIDDYAHHPEELRVCITSVKSLYPTKKLTILFQPHLYSRTQDFANGFAEVLSMADELLLLDIYPARELPIDGVTSNIIFDKVTLHNKQLLSKEAAINWIKIKQPALLLTVGAGDIDQMIEPLKQILQHA